jgi:hypothetical protein
VVAQTSASPLPTLQPAAKSVSMLAAGIPDCGIVSGRTNPFLL